MSSSSLNCMQFINISIDDRLYYVLYSLDQVSNEILLIVSNNHLGLSLSKNSINNLKPPQSKQLNSYVILLTQCFKQRYINDKIYNYNMKLVNPANNEYNFLITKKDQAILDIKIQFCSDQSYFPYQIKLLNYIAAMCSGLQGKLTEKNNQLSFKANLLNNSISSLNQLIQHKSYVEQDLFDIYSKLLAKKDNYIVTQQSQLNSIKEQISCIEKDASPAQPIAPVNLSKKANSLNKRSHAEMNVNHVASAGVVVRKAKKPFTLARPLAAAANPVIYNNKHNPISINTQSQR
jgi:hypothetical protein